MEDITLRTCNLMDCIIILTESEALEVFPQVEKITIAKAVKFLEMSGDGIRETYNPNKDTWEKFSYLVNQVPRECININWIL